MMRTAAFIILLQFCLSVDAAVPSAYQNIAAEYNHPPELLFSIALAESGHRYNGQLLPWPWAVNHAGKALYFDTREDAYAYCSALLDQNDTNFDVGLMQVNWYWNGKRFATLWDAFEPYTNIRVGAEILRDYYQETGSYEMAVGYYHSHTADKANQYREGVRHMLSRVKYGERQ